MLLVLLACMEPTGETGLGGTTVQRPDGNILLVVLDDVGTDAVAAYGEHPLPAQTPTLDGLARDGLMFRHAYASPVCSPTRAQMLTGRHARRTGFGEGVFLPMDEQLPLREVTIAEHLLTSERDWSTAAVGKWHLAGGLSASGAMHPLHQGFQTHRGSLWNLEQATDLKALPTDYFHWEKSIDGVTEITEVYATTDTVNEAVALVGELPEPWFVYVALNAAHEPAHTPPSALLQQTLGPDPDLPSQYLAMVEAADHELGRLLNSVPESTHVIVMGDNGVPGQFSRPPTDPDQTKLTVYEGGIGVPLLLRSPWVSQPGREVADLVHAVDLFPTIAGLANLEASDVIGSEGQTVSLDGESLVPLITDPDADLGREYVFAERLGPLGPPPWSSVQVAVRDQRYKYIEVRLPGVPPAPTLHDLEARVDDGPNLLGQIEGLSAEQQEALDRLRAALSTFEELPYEGP